jgi:hypothetical protein
LAVAAIVERVAALTPIMEVVQRILGDDPFRPQRDSRRRSAACPGSHSGYPHQRAAAPGGPHAASAVDADARRRAPPPVRRRPCGPARAGSVLPPPGAMRREIVRPAAVWLTLTAQTVSWTSGPSL